MPRDISLLLATAKHRENPDFLMQAEQLGSVVTCFACGKVIGAAIDKERAEADVVENGTGVFMKGNWFCPEHSDGEHPPVPLKLQKHKSSPARR